MAAPPEASDDALRIPKCSVQKFSFMLPKVGYERYRGSSGFPARASKPSLIYEEGVNFRKNYRALNDVLQLAYVSGPVVGLEEIHGLLVDCANLLAHLLGVAIDEVPEQ